MMKKPNEVEKVYGTKLEWLRSSLKSLLQSKRILNDQKSRLSNNNRNSLLKYNICIWVILYQLAQNPAQKFFLLKISVGGSNRSLKPLLTTAVRHFLWKHYRSDQNLCKSRETFECKKISDITLNKFMFYGT